MTTTTDNMGLKTVEQKLDKPEGDSRDKDLVRQVNNWFKEALDARSVKDPKLLEQYKIYRFYGDHQKFPWRSDIYIPMGFVNIEVMTAKMLSAIMASDPFFNAQARAAQFMGAEGIVTQLMLKQQAEMGFKRVLHDWIKDHYIYGVGILKGFWRYEEVVEEVETVKFRQVFTKINGELIEDEPEPYTVTEKQRRIVFDGPAFEVVNIFDFYLDPDATSVKTARYAIHRKEVTIDHLRAMADKNVYRKAAVDQIAKTQQQGTTESHEKIVIDEIEHDHIHNAQSGLIEIKECWTPTRKIVVGPSDILLQDGKNPFGQINFFDLPHLPSGHKFFGVALNEPVTKIQQSLNKVHRLRFDNWNIHVHKMFLVSEDAIRNPSDIVARPGGYIRVKGGRELSNAVQELSKQPLPMESYTEANDLERLNENATSVNEPAKGLERRGGKPETATKTRLSAAGSSVRFGVELILIEPKIQEVLEFHHMLNQKFMDQERVIRVIGQEGATYPLAGPQHVLGDFDFTFELAPLQGNSEAWIGRLMLVYNLYMQNPMIAPMTNWEGFSTRIAKAAELRDVGNLFGRQFIQQNLALNAAIRGGGNAAAQGGGGQTGPATNPQVGAANAQMRAPQPTAGDTRRDILQRTG